MATPVPGEDNHSTTEQGPQISGPESETSVSRHVDLTLNAATPIPIYNPYMQQVGPQNYPSFQRADSHQSYYDQQDYASNSIHEGNVYTAPAELRRGYQEYHPPSLQALRTENVALRPASQVIRQRATLVSSSLTFLMLHKHWRCFHDSRDIIKKFRTFQLLTCFEGESEKGRYH